MADFLTYLNIQDAIERYVKMPKGGKEGLVKDVINMVYLNEICVCDDLYPLFWLIDFDDSLASIAPTNIESTNQADPGILKTTTDHNLSVGDIISIYNIVGMTELNNRVYKIKTRVSSNQIELIDLEDNDAIDTSGMTAYSSGGTIHHRGVTLGTTPTGSEVQRIIGFPKWHDEGIMNPISIEDVEKEDKLDDNTARPEHYLHKKIFKNDGTEVNYLLWFYGADAAYDLRYWFEKRVSPLSADADVPRLPPQFHHSIISGALTRLAENKVQVENAVIWPGLYKAQLTQLRAFNRKWWQENKKYKKPYMM